MAFIDFFQRILPKSFLSKTFLNAWGIYQAIAVQFDDLKAGILDGQNQLFIDSVTWQLPVYESEFGIKLIDQSNTQARRNNVMAMSRGGLGANPGTITNVLQSYGYATQIVEDFPNYKVTIKFTDFKGVPSNINDLKALMTRFIPGHLQLNWAYLYNLYSDYEGKYTWGQMPTSGLTWQDVMTKLP